MLLSTNLYDIKKSLDNIFLKILETPRIEPGPAGWEARRQPLNYANPRTVDFKGNQERMVILNLAARSLSSPLGSLLTRAWMTEVAPRRLTTSPRQSLIDSRTCPWTLVVFQPLRSDDVDKDSGKNAWKDWKDRFNPSLFKVQSRTKSNGKNCIIKVSKNKVH